MGGGGGGGANNVGRLEERRGNVGKQWRQSALFTRRQ